MFEHDDLPEPTNGFEHDSEWDPSWDHMESPWAQSLAELYG